jgi:hypothetical protein
MRVAASTFWQRLIPLWLAAILVAFVIVRLLGSSTFHRMTRAF